MVSAEKCFHNLIFFRYCNTTHVGTVSTKDKIKTNLPNLFQSHILCAGSDVPNQGSCEGDSGGPLMIKNRELSQCKILLTSLKLQWPK